MSNYDDIRSALEIKLNSIVGLPAIAWENKSYTPITGTPFITVTQINTARRSAVVGPTPQQRYQGIFQLLCNFPQDKGPGPTEDVVNTLLDNFQVATDLSFTNSEPKTVYVTIQYAEQVGAFSNGPWYTTPVNIGWYSYISP